MTLKEYLVYSLPIYFLEIMAVWSCYVYFKNGNNDRPTRLLLGVLIFTLVLEIFASYSAIGYFSDYKWFSFLKESSFRRNNWLYNIYDIINPILISSYLMYFMNSLKIKSYLKLLFILFVFYSIWRIFFTINFYDADSYITLTGSVLILISLCIFFYEILKTNVVLKLWHYLPFYISIGVLFFHLLTTPALIFSKYFNTSTGNFAFVKFQTTIVLIANIIMYSSFTIGFLICSKKKKYS